MTLFIVASWVSLIIPAANAGLNRPSSAVDSELVAFDLPSQPLTTALTAYAKVSGIRLAYQANLTRNCVNPPLKGAFTREQALAILIEASNLSYHFTGDRTVTLLDRSVEDARAQATELTEINVEGKNEKEQGYVAVRSSIGTKTDTPLIETPQSISVVTRDQIDTQGALSVSQALRYTSGVVPEYRGAQSRYDLPYVRGFGGLTQLQYLDGMKLPVGSFAMPQVDQYNIGAVEVLKGPSSVLYGQNLPGGLNNLISKRPTSEPFHEIIGQVGSFGRVQGGLDVGGPIDKEKTFLYRFTASGHLSDTQVDFTKDQRISVAPALTWRPTADTSVTFLTSYQNDPKNGYYGFLPAQGTFLPNPNRMLPTSFFEGDPGFDKFTRSQFMTGYLFDHRFDEVWSFKQNFRYTKVDTDYQSVFGQGLQPNLRFLNRGVQTSLEHLDGITTDNQFTAKFNTGPIQHTALFGVDYQWSTFKQDRDSGVAPALDITNPVYYQKIPTPNPLQRLTQDRDQVGLYAQNQMKFGNLVLLLGGREDFANSSSVDTLRKTNQTQSDDAFTGRAGAVYLFENGVAPYVSYSESFLPTVGTDFFGNPFKPTTGKQYEGGVKFQPVGYNSFITASAFDLTQQNLTTADTAHPTFSVQTGEVHMSGVEIEGKASLADGFNLIGAFTHMRSEVTQSNGTDLGKRPVLLPVNTASLWADYTIQEGQLNGLGFGFGARHVGSTYGDAANTFMVPSYTVFDAMVRYDFSKLSSRLAGYMLTVNASNLFDKEYVSGCTYIGGCYFASRRTILATLRYRW